MTERLSDIVVTDINIKTQNRDFNRYENILRVNDKSFIRCINNNIEISPVHHMKFNGTVDFTDAIVSGLKITDYYDESYLLSLIALKSNSANPLFTGNVGINTTIPSSTLDVVGDATISGTVTSTFIGDGSGLTVLGSIGTHTDVDITTATPNIGQSLVFDGTQWVPGNATASSVIYPVSALLDVDVTGLAVNDSLIWNGTNWIPSPIGGVPLGGLTDVDLTGLVDQQVIVWNASTSTWVPKNHTDPWIPTPNGIEYSSGVVTIGSNLFFNPSMKFGVFDTTLTPNTAVISYIGKEYTNYNGFNQLYFHIADNSTSNYYSINSFGGSIPFVITGGGNVGIGITNPSYEFQTVGTINSNLLTVGNGTFNVSPENLLAILDNTTTAATSRFITLGKSHTANDSGYIEYYHENDGDSLNHIRIGMFPLGGTYVKINSTGTVEAAGGGILSFTGQHINHINDSPKGDLQGLIVSANNNQYLSLNGEITKGKSAINIDEALPIVSLSKKYKDKACFGVISKGEGSEEKRKSQIGAFVSSADKIKGDNRFIINSLGEGGIWVINKGGNFESGDYITTSNIPGYGEKQDSEFLANYTVAKITMDCDFTSPLVNKERIKREVDKLGNMKWETIGEQETAYETRYIDQNGNITSKENSTYTAAFVGCTYHCG